MSASALAGELGVSRQIVVGDVALLRAAGRRSMQRPGAISCTRRHGAIPAFWPVCTAPQDEMRTELYTVVDQGGIVVDVAVENSLYGELRGNLNLASRYDVDNFIQQAEDTPEAC